MTEKRRGYAPYSLTRKAGVQSATVNGDIDVIQEVRPTINAGFLDEVGNWKGQQSSDDRFIDLQTDLAIADNAEILSDKVIDMYGYSRFNIAIQPSRAGNYTFELILGGTTDDGYLNLKPINTNFSARATIRTDSATNAFTTLLNDQETIAADVWSVYQVNDVGDFKLKLKVTNQSGGNSNIQTAIQRLV
jgi:hypothetical protein